MTDIVPGGAGADVIDESRPKALLTSGFQPEVSVVVPTRNEAGNIEELLRRLDAALGALTAEVLFVDDSDDETPEVIRRAAGRWPRTVWLVHRPAGQRTGGLGGAVIAGFRTARAPWAVVMDGDLQHPPEIVPALVQTGIRAGVDLVAGSRYRGVGVAGGLDGRLRVSVSATCTTLTKWAFPFRLRGVSDPMSGLFAVRLASLDLEVLRPPGYKVLLEVLARAQLRTAEVPYTFQNRFSGESKASIVEGGRFLRQLLLLRLLASRPRMRQIAQFLAVGGTGVIVNTLVLWLLNTSASVPYLAASAIATQVAILWNFALLERLVFRHDQHHGLPSRFGRFWLLNVALLPVQLALLALGVDGLHARPVAANLVVLGVVFLLRYAVSAGWVYRAADSKQSGTVPVTPPLASAVGLRLVEQTPGERPDTVSRGRLRYVVRVALPPLATVIAFPGVLHTLGGTSALRLAAFASLLYWLVLWFAFSVPRPGEPDVHDRQLDLILGLPLLAAAVWLALRTGRQLTQPLLDTGVLAMALFLAGTSLLLLGTRLSLRLRGVMLLSLLILPVVDHLSVLLTALTALAAIALIAALVRRRDRLTPPGVRGEARRARLQPLPKVKPGLAVVGAVTGLLLWPNAHGQVEERPPVSAAQEAATVSQQPAPPVPAAPVPHAPPVPAAPVPHAPPVPAAPVPHALVPRTPIAGLGGRLDPFLSDSLKAQRVLQEFAYSTDVAERRALLQRYAALTGRAIGGSAG